MAFLGGARRRRRQVWILTTLASLLCTTAVHAQTAGTAERPEFSGMWLSISDPNATDVATAAQLPFALLTIVHDGARFEVERSWSGASIPARFVCDGRQNSNGYSIVVERTTCRWETTDGGQFVIEGSIGRADGSTTGKLRERYRIDKEGVLHVERTREVFNASNGPRTTTARYRKVSAK